MIAWCVRVRVGECACISCGMYDTCVYHMQVRDKEQAKAMMEDMKRKQKELAAAVHPQHITHHATPSSRHIHFTGTKKQET